MVKLYLDHIIIRMIGQELMMKQVSNFQLDHTITLLKYLKQEK